MNKLIAGFLIMALPMAGLAQSPGEAQQPETAPGQSSESVSPGGKPGDTSPGGKAGSADTQSDAYYLCLRATQLFDQQEQAKGNTKTEITSLETSCKEELKPAAYWRCMEKQAVEKVDINTAHWRCGKQTNVVK